MTGHRGRGRDCARGGCARAHGINLVTANHDHQKDQAEEKGVKASHILILL